MKKVLGWAIVATCMAMAVYFGMVGLNSGDSTSAALTAASVAVGVTFAGFIYSFRALLAFTVVAFAGAIFSDVLAVVLSTLLIAFGAAKIAREVEVEFKWAFIAYLIEGAGIYATLKLGLWQPAAVAALFLGLWWLATRLAEKKKLRLASV